MTEKESIKKEIASKEECVGFERILYKNFSLDSLRMYYNVITDYYAFVNNNKIIYDTGLERFDNLLNDFDTFCNKRFNGESTDKKKQIGWINK